MRPASRTFKKINIVDRLSRHLEKGTTVSAASAYLQQIKKWTPPEPVVHIDDSDVAKPDGLGQDYVIRLKSNRKLLYHNKWTMATGLHNRWKGKVKTNVPVWELPCAQAKSNQRT